MTRNYILVQGPLGDQTLASDYLAARSEAWDRGMFDDGTQMDPVLTDFRDDEPLTAMLWLAFMAGSDWERNHRGRRFNYERTATA